MDGLKDRTQHVVLETNRLRFATWVKEDWEEFRKLTSDPLVVRYITTGEPWPDERVKEFVARQIENWEKHGICLARLSPMDLRWAISNESWQLRRPPTLIPFE
jgi:hypothetical protein